MMKALFRIILYLSLNVAAYGALDAGIVWEIQTGGSQNNGGGFKAGASGTDYSQQAAAQYALVNMSAVGASATITDANAAAVMVGNVIRVTGGTNATQGWYEITSVNAGVDITVDRNWCTGACSNGTGNVGGAWAFNGSLDDDFMEAKVAGNTIWIKSGTHTLGEVVSLGTSGTSANPIRMYGYQTTRGDEPEGDNRPLISGGARWWAATAQYRNYDNIRFSTTTANPALALGAWSSAFNCKATGGTSGVGFQGGSGGTFIACEATCPTGTGINQTSTGATTSCYVRDCATGIATGGPVIDCIVESCQTGIDFGGTAYMTGCVIRACLLGVEGGTVDASMFLNNVITYCVTGASCVAQENQRWDYNCWYGNGTDYTNITAGPHDVTTDPGIAAGIVEGADGVTDGAGTVFTAASNPFSGVDTGDTLVIVEAGTGATLGVYTIASVDGAGQITLDSSAGASKTGIDYKINKGEDFTKGSAGGGKGNGVGPGKKTDATDNDPDIGGTPNTNTSGFTQNKTGNKS